MSIWSRIDAPATDDLRGLIHQLKALDPSIKTDRQVAAILGVTPNTLSRYQTGMMQPLPRVARQLVAERNSLILYRLSQPERRALALVQEQALDPGRTFVDAEAVALVFGSAFAVMTAAAFRGDTETLRDAIVNVAEQLSPKERLLLWRDLARRRREAAACPASPRPRGNGRKAAHP